MTPHERKEVRNELLNSYLETVEDRKAHCGRLSTIITVLRRIIAMYDNRTLRVQKNSAPISPTIEDGSADGYRIPTHDDLMAAFVDCRNAEQREALARIDAIKGGVDPDFLPQSAALEKPSETITVAGSLA